jgi:hypothetical protein
MNPMKPVSKPISMGPVSNPTIYVNEKDHKELKRIVDDLNKISKNVHSTKQNEYKHEFDVNTLASSLLPKSAVHAG